jgi:hypothetical protein
MPHRTVVYFGAAVLAAGVLALGIGVLTACQRVPSRRWTTPVTEGCPVAGVRREFTTRNTASTRCHDAMRASGQLLTRPACGR